MTVQTRADVKTVPEPARLQKHESNGSNAKHESNGSNAKHESNGSSAKHESNGSSAKHESNGSNAKHESNGSNAKHESNGSNAKHESNGSNAKHESNGISGGSEKRKRERDDDVNDAKRSRADESRYWCRGDSRQKNWGGDRGWQDNREAAKGPHQLTLKKKYIHQIRNKTRDGLQKTIEGRINSGVVLRYKKGDLIRFFYQADQSDDVTCVITDIKKYRSFKEMLEAEGVQKCLTDVRSLAEGVRIYDSIPSYTQRAAQHGVVAIHISVV